MASTKESFDAEKMRREIFQARKEDVSTTIEFVAETARLLTEKGREREIVYIADRSAELLQGNFTWKKLMLLMLIKKCGLKPGWSDILKYYIKLEKLFDNSTAEIKVRLEILLTIASTYLTTSHYSQAFSCLTKAKHIAEQLKDKFAEANCSGGLGDVYLGQGDYKKAIQCYQESLSISNEMGNRSGIASSNGNLGNAFRDLGQYEKAIEHYKKALTIGIEIGDRLEISKNNGNLGSAYLSMGQYEKAIEYYKKSLTISNEIGDRSGIASNNGNLGSAYLSMGQYEKAIEYYKKSLTISNEIGDRSGIASNNGNLGNVFRHLGQYQKAIEFYKKSVLISTEIGDRSGIASNNGNLGNVYSSVGQYEKAIEYYKKGLTISSEIGDRSGVANKNGNLGNAYLKLGQYDKAIEYYKKSLTISSEIGYRSGIASTYEGMGCASLRMGQYEKAIEYYKRGLTISNEIGDRSGIASSNGNLGNAYLSLQQYEKAIEYYKKGITISNEIGDPSKIAANNGGLGNAYLSMGQYEKAIEYYKKGLTISSEIGDREGIAMNIGKLGNAYLSLAQYEKAIEYYQKSLKISIEIGDRSQIAIHNGNLGSTYLSMKQWEKAIEHFKISLGINSDIGDRTGIAYNNANLGNAYCNLGQYKKAIEVSKRGFKESIEISNTWTKSRCAANIGLAYLLGIRLMTCLEKGLNDINQAISYFKTSIECGDEIFSELAVDENMSSFSNEYFMMYVYLMECFIVLNRVEAAFLTIDVGKAKALQAFVEQRKKTKAVNIMDYTRKTWQAIDNNEENNQICNIEQSLELKRCLSTVLFFAFDRNMFLNVWVLNGVDSIKHVCLMKSENLVLHEAHIFRALKGLLEPFSVNLTRDSGFYTEDSGTLSEKQNKEQFSLISEYHDYVYPIKRESCVPQNLENLQRNDHIFSQDYADVVPRYGLDVDMEKLHRLPKSKNITLWKVMNYYDLEDHTDPNCFETSGFFLNILFKQLINPVKALIKGTKLIIVPEKFLFFAPFSALEDETNSPLSKHYSVQVTPSLHTLYTSMNQLHHACLGFALFVGNPKVGKVSFRRRIIEPSQLPSATTEVRCLAPLFDTKPLVEGDAVKKRVLNLMRDAGIIHISAHGEPKRGEILLAPNPSLTNNASLPREESYLLRQADVIDIRISARLVVLCCCHTGRGKVASEGVIGLTRAFLAAGAHSVLATLWPIDDEGTKLFMENFYAEVCGETSVCEALRRTMNKFQQHKNNECCKVRIWAPFTIYGADVKFAEQDIEEIKKKSREIFF